LKTATKILHLVWAAFWSFMVFWAFLDDFSWSDPASIATMPLCLVWLPFAFGLLFERQWAWYGSFGFSVLSLFVALYVLFLFVSLSFTLQEASDVYGWREFLGVGLAITVVGLLLHTRHQFLKPVQNRAS